MKTKAGRPHRSPATASLLERKMDAYWRGGEYLSVGQIYLYDNPLLRRAAAAGGYRPPPTGPTGARRPGSTSSTFTSIASSKQYGPERHLRYRAGPWWTGARREHLSGGLVTASSIQNVLAG